ECGPELSNDDGLRVPCLALLELLADADERREATLVQCGHLLAGLLVGFAEYMPAFGVTHQRPACSGLSGDRHRHLAGKGSLRCPVYVLRTGACVRAAAERFDDCRKARRRREEPELRPRPRVRLRKEALHELPRGLRAVMHLPVGGKDQPTAHGYDLVSSADVMRRPARQRRGVPFPPGTPAMRRRRWTRGSSGPRDLPGPPPPRNPRPRRR